MRIYPLIASFVLLAGCSPHKVSTKGYHPAIEVEMISEPASNTKYHQMANKARLEIELFFQNNGFKIKSPPIKKMVVIASREKLRKTLSAEFKVPMTKIPQTVGATPKGDTLFIGNRNVLAPIMKNLYKIKTFDDDDLFRVIKHEIFHMYHEQVALNYTNSANGMGPLWLFEGLACFVANNFPNLKKSQMNKNEILDIIEASKKKPQSYLKYTQIIFTLSQKTSMAELIRAGFSPTKLSTIIENLE